MNTSDLLNRRRFLSLSAASIGLFAAVRCPRVFASPVAAQNADLVVYNAKIYTMNSRHPVAEACAVTGGRFVVVGSTAEVKALIGKNTDVLDAGHMVLVPGFIDCHNHASGMTLLYEVLVGNPYEVEFVSIDSIVAKLRAKAASTPKGMWVEGYFYDDTKVTDRRLINVHDLNQVSTDHPVAVHHRGGHTSFYNSNALQLAGITRNTPPVSGGTFDRDADGDLNGRVSDNAMDVFDKVGDRPQYSIQQTLERERAGLSFISTQFARYGLTSVCHESGNLRALEQVRDRGELKHRVSYEADGVQLEAMISAGMTTGLGDEWIRLGATYEHTTDGSFSERTMALSSPYPGSTSGYRGNVTESQEVLNAWCERVHRAGIQMNCHANGDVAIDHVLTAYERALTLVPHADARPRITHCTLINDDLIQRMKAIGAVPTPFTSYAYYNADKFHFYGEDLMKRCMAYRTFLDAGIVAAAGSDFDPGPFAPLMGIQGMVTRTGWNGEIWGANQRVTVDEAIRTNTLNGAYATREESIKGSIEPGKLADFVLLSEDPHAIELGKIKDIKVVRTVVGGLTSYRA